MKNLITTTILAVSAVGLCAQTITYFDDDYRGGVPTNSSDTYEDDVIGDPNVFDIDGFNFIQDAESGSLTIQIFGNYFEKIVKGDSGLLGTYMGDLFISTNELGWEDPGAATLTDYFGNVGDTNGPETTTKWDYAVAIEPRGTDTNPNKNRVYSADVYNITDETRIELSSANGIYRENQEVSYSGTDQEKVDTNASWYISDTYSFLGITLDDPASLFGTNETIGFHWTMSCGNDVIEFEYAYANPVPEPSHIGALGIASVLALMAVRRRLKARKG